MDLDIENALSFDCDPEKFTEDECEVKAQEWLDNLNGVKSGEGMREKRFKHYDDDLTFWTHPTREELDKVLVTLPGMFTILS